VWSVIKRAARATKDPAQRLRILWFVLGIAVSLVFMEIGGGYAFAGKEGTLVPTAFRVILLGGHLPGGFHTHGWIMVLLGLLQLWGISSISQRCNRWNWNLVQVSAYGLIGYSIWITVAFAGGSLLTHQYNAAIWFYLFTAIIATAKTLLPPPFRR